jgi:hypothetical protein
LQIYPQNEVPADINCIEAKLLDGVGVARILGGYQSAAPLGMIADEDEFRIIGVRRRAELSNVLSIIKAACCSANRLACIASCNGC